MRQVKLELFYNEINIDVSDFIEGFTYSDKTKHAECDNISVTFQDVDGLWRGAWYPELGSKFSAKITATDWFNIGDSFTRAAGGFELDDLSSSGKPSTFTISAVSVGISNSIRRQQNTKAWENIRVQDIFQEIATKHGFELKFYSNYNPILERWEQIQESDITLIKNICEYAGLMIKITDKNLIIFRCEEFDQKDLEITIKASEGVTGWNFNSSTSDIYSSVEVRYYDQDLKDMVEYVYIPDGISGVRGGKKKLEREQSPGRTQVINPETRMVEYVEQPTQPVEVDEEPEITDPEVGQVLKVNRRVSSLAEAEELAKSLLRNANMMQVKGMISSIGRPDIYSGLNVKLDGFGRWDGVVWNVIEVTHEYSRSGYTSNIELRGVLGF